jgi:hypothetical protein
MNKSFVKVALTASLMTPLIASAFCSIPMYGNNMQLNQMAQAAYQQCMQQQQYQQQQQQYQQQQRLDQQSQQMQQSIDNQQRQQQQRNDPFDFDRQNNPRIRQY